MPVQNEARFLGQALESLQRQTLTDWELVVVDDGSSDATPVLLDSAAKNDDRITVITQRRQGIVTALNAGLQLCRASLIARMDGDDVAHPERLEKQVRFLQDHTGVGLVACSFRHFPRQVVKSGMIAYERWQNGLITHDLISRDIYVESPFVHPSVMMRAALLLDLQGYRDMGWPEDYDLWLRMAARGTRFARLRETLFYWREHPSRSTRVMDEYAQAAFRACKAHHLVRGFLCNTTEVVIAGAGLEGRAWGRLLAEHGIRVRFWLDVDPRKIGRDLHGAPVLPATMAGEQGLKTVAAIGVAGGREQFRALAAEKGLAEGRDFVCVS